MISIIGSFLFSSKDACRNLRKRSIQDVEIKPSDIGISQKIIKWKDGTVYYGEC